MLKTSKTPHQLTQEINPLVAKDDKVLIVLVDPKRPADGLMPNKAWEWINKVYGEEKLG